MVPWLCCAYLRVYEPLDAFPEAVRRRIQQLAVEGSPPGPLRLRGSVRPMSLGLLAPAERREVYVRDVDGVWYVCPAQTRLRALVAMLAVQQSLPSDVPDLFFTSAELEGARRELEALQAEGRRLRPHLVQSAWHVPLRWFVCFDDAERRIEHAGDHATIRYETTVGRALQRLDEASRTLEGGVVHPVMTAMIQDLAEWLRSFDPRSLLELDYASVARLFTEDELADDRSAADIWCAIEALASRDVMRAVLHYQRANERWASKRSVETLN